MNSANSKLEELKKICSGKKDIAMSLYTKIGNDILRRDMKLLLEKHNEISNPKPDYYTMESFEFKINGDILEVIDRRKDAFLWCFGVILNNNFRLGDAFTFDKQIYSVSFLDNISNENMLSEIENVISEYNATIQYLKENEDYTKYTYYYECEHEEVKCPDIFEVYSKVLNREC